MSPKPRPDDDGRDIDVTSRDRFSDLADVPRDEDTGLEIRGGGAVAVDTDTLRSTATRFLGAKAELEEVSLRLSWLHTTVFALRDHAWDAVSSFSTLAQRLLHLQSEAERIAGALREAAIAYELVELSAEHRVAVAAGDTARATWIDARITWLSEKYPGAWSTALGAELDRAVNWPGELTRQATEGGLLVGSEFGGPAGVATGAALGLGTIAGAAVLGVGGAGRLARDARLEGSAGPVKVQPVPVAGASAAPRTLADAAARMPGAGESRVRVERYAMPDGTRQYAVYIAGTQAQAYGGADPWDHRSNLQLYTGKQSESFAATKQALAAAGAEPGDSVHVFGLSQGAMIGAHLALEGEYDTKTLVTFGSPVAADVGDGTLSVTVRHTDDPITALAGGGHNAAVGAPGSIVVERVSHPATGMDDARLPSHHMSAYAETAALIDASSDPRVDGLRSVLDELNDAESIEVTEYSATRG